MPSEGDRQLEAALESFKKNNAAYLVESTPSRERECARSMSGLAKKMDATANPALRQRAAALRKVKDRFEGSKSVLEKRNIAATVGKTLVNITVKKLVFWGIGGIATLAVAGGLMYTIATEGQWADAYDTNGDGWTDDHGFDINGDGVADKALVDTDYDHDFDAIVDVNEGVVEASGGITEGVISFFSNFF